MFTIFERKKSEIGQWPWRYSNLYTCHYDLHAHPLNFYHFIQTAEWDIYGFAIHSNQTCVSVFIKQPTALKGQHFVIPKFVHFNSTLTCTKQLPAFKGHYNMSLDWLL